MAFFELVIDLELLPANPQGIMEALKNLQKKLDLSRPYTAREDRRNNINQTKGLIQDYFAKKDTSTLGQGAELIQAFKNSLLRSRIETAKNECKQGLLDLSPSRKLNNDLIPRVVETFAELPTPIQALMDIFFWEWLRKSKAVGLGDVRYSGSQ